MADEPKPTVDMKEEEKKTEKLAEPQKIETPKPKEPLKPAEPKPQTPEPKAPEDQKEKLLVTKPEEKLKEPGKPVKKKEVSKPKKSEASVRGVGLPISTKKATGICKFIKGKTIENAISDLEQVLQKKKYVPIRGEIPHKKGPGKVASGSGSYPKKASENFIKLLKNLQTNANINGLDQPIITEAIANIASRPLGRFGRIKRKRTHVKIVVKEKKLISISKTKNKEKKNGRKKSSTI